MGLSRRAMHHKLVDMFKLAERVSTRGRGRGLEGWGFSIGQNNVVRGTVASAGRQGGMLNKVLLTR